MGMFLRRGMATAGKEIGLLDPGTAFILNESGIPVEFYVAKHDYQSDLNGAGRTLIVRKDCYDDRIFGSSSIYDGSSIDGFCNTTYVALLDSDIRSKLGLTKIKVTTSSSNGTIKTIQRAAFLLSMTELGKTNADAKTEGESLPIASLLVPAYKDGSAVVQWTRTIRYNYSNYDFCIGADGGVYTHRPALSHGSRPAFTLPADTIVKVA